MMLQKSVYNFVTNESKVQEEQVLVFQLFYVDLHGRGRVQCLGVMSSGHKPSGPRRDLETPGR